MDPEGQGETFFVFLSLFICNNNNNNKNRYYYYIQEKSGGENKTKKYIYTYSVAYLNQKVV